MTGGPEMEVGVDAGDGGGQVCARNGDRRGDGRSARRLRWRWRVGQPLRDRARRGDCSSGHRAESDRARGHDNERVTPNPPVSDGTTQLSGNFRLVVTKIEAIHETVDHALEVDGKRDEVQLRAQTLTLAGNTVAEARGQTLGDLNGISGRVQAGTASSKGGIKTGDVTGPGCCTLPFPLWSGRLSADGSGVIVVPMLWEMDDVCDSELTEPDWQAGLTGFGPTLLGDATGHVRDRLGLPRLPEANPPVTKLVAGDLDSNVTEEWAVEDSNL